MLQVNVNLDINDKLYLKNPQETELGRRIIEHGVLLIDEIGFEHLTFRKLAERIQSTEASIYRYFENKGKLFVYLVNWYWEWMRFRVRFFTINISDPKQQLRAAIRAVVDTSQKSTSVSYIDTVVLHRIVVTEGPKAYHKKNVDEENQYGFFLSYKMLCGRIAEIILEIEPGYPYPRALGSMLLETANNNIYFAQHLPRLTDIKYSEHYLEEVLSMLYAFAEGCIQQGGKPGGLEP
ncbi:MAG: TetR family transcriptional regulator [Bacteroidetes bacterium]|jgi:AcrR family transcriptional regulator|nr:TetR family transcriptional regulator [Bacteroidota bacterium]